VQLIAIGNGTASRETDKLAGELIKLQNRLQRPPTQEAEKMVVSEAGASVYSASEFASAELPDVDVSLRGAASIARPAGPAGRAGQDRPQEHRRGPVPARRQPERAGAHAGRRGRRLRERRGRGPEHRQRPLLARVSGLSAAVAKAVVRWREQHGAFANRQQLLQVSGLGPRPSSRRGLCASAAATTRWT
jgi:uncharacterized protein